MHEIKFNITEGGKKKTKVAEVAANWQECSEQLVLDSMPLVMANQKNGAVLTRLLHLSMNGTGKILLELQPDLITALLPCVEWMFEDSIDSPLVSSFWHKGKEYLLPDAKLENSTCLEWYLADDYFKKIQKKRDPKDITRLVATLARSRSPNHEEAAKRDDFRVELHSRKQVDMWAADLEDLDERVKLFVLAFFSGCKEWVHDTYTGYIFEEPEELEEGQEPEPKELTFMQKLEWYGLFQKAAENGVFGTLEDILKRVKFKDFCIYLMAKKAEFDEEKRRMDALKNRNTGSEY